MNRFLLSFFLLFSLIFLPTGFSKDLHEDSSSVIINNVTTDLITDSEDIKLKYKAGKGLEFKGGDAGGGNSNMGDSSSPGESTPTYSTDEEPF